MERRSDLTLDNCDLVVQVEVRWGDMDAFGHLNNVMFIRYFEVARVAYFDLIEFREGARIGPILHSTSCRFRRPVTYPDTVRVGVRTTDLTDDRFTHEYLMVSDTTGETVATGQGVVVSYDYEQGCKTSIPGPVRERIISSMKTAVRQRSSNAN